MEEYDYQWLLENLIHLRMAKSAIPIFWTSDEDPKDITDLKNRLDDIKNSIENLERFIYHKLMPSVEKK